MNLELQYYAEATEHSGQWRGPFTSFDEAYRITANALADAGGGAGRVIGIAFFPVFVSTGKFDATPH